MRKSTIVKILLIQIIIMLSGCASMSRHNVKDWTKVDAGPKPDFESARLLIQERVK